MKNKIISDILWHLYLRSDSSSPSHNYLADRYFYHYFPNKIKKCTDNKIKECTDKYLLMKY